MEPRSTYMPVSWASPDVSGPIDLKSNYRWLLAEVADTHGNRVTYSYICTAAPVCYPSEILYLNSGVTDPSAGDRIHRLPAGHEGSRNPRHRQGPRRASAGSSRASLMRVGGTRLRAYKLSYVLEWLDRAAAPEQGPAVRRQLGGGQRQQHHRFVPAALGF